MPRQRWVDRLAYTQLPKGTVVENRVARNTNECPRGYGHMNEDMEHLFQ